MERLHEYAVYEDLEDAWTKKDVENNWLKNGTISITDLKVRYREGQPLVLKGINLEVAENEKIGIIGRTGSGKSTLLLAIFRMMEKEASATESGTIRISGVDTMTLGLHQLRESLSIIPQDPFLMQGTLRLNLDPFHKFSDSEILEFLSKVEVL